MREKIISTFPETTKNLPKVKSLSLTLYYNMRIGMDGVNVVARKAGVLSAVSLIDTLNVKTAGGCDVDAGVHRQGRLVSFSPCYSGLRLTRRAALQCHALPHQHLSVLWLDHKTRPS